MRILTLIGAALFFLMAAPAQSQELTSVSCLDGGGVGWAECEAVCPSGQQVLHCSQSLGQIVGGDSCTAISRMQIGATDARGQANGQPHDRCKVAVQCADSSQTLSVQVFATCYTP